MIFSIWLTAVIIQTGITISLALQFLKFRSRESEKSLTFSIIIAAHNELENLRLLISELIKQDHHDFEIVVALDRCTDSSAKYLESVDFKNLKTVEISERVTGHDPKKYALTRAVEVAEKNWLVFSDADCTPATPHWLNSIQNRVKTDTQIVLGYSPYLNKGSFLHHFIGFEAFITGFNYLSMALLKRPYMGVGRNMAVNRQFFKQRGGYENFKSVTGGDDDLFIQANSTKKNTEIAIGRDSLVHSVPKHSWRDYFIQKTRHLSVGSRYSVTDQLFHFLFNGSLLLVWALIPFISLEIILPIILFYLILKVIGYRFASSKMGAGFNYILLPLVDFLYAIFLPIIAVRSKFVKDIKWKN